jgi:hypothetical protein
MSQNLTLRRGERSSGRKAILDQSEFDGTDQRVLELLASDRER